ncbi:MAG: DUF2341 domain-containing protein, partial [Thermoplasmata archaeon]
MAIRNSLSTDFTPYRVWSGCRVLAVLTALNILLNVPSLGLSNTSPLLDVSPPTDTRAPWWDINWTNRRPITISGKGIPQNLTDYQILINVSWCEGMSSSFSDLRFVQYDQLSGESKELPYFIEKKTDRELASVWVKVWRIGRNTDTDIYLYYGDLGASSASNSSATLEIYSPFYFSLDGWTYGGPPSYELKLDGSTGNPPPSSMILGNSGPISEPGQAYIERNISKPLGLGLQITIDYRARAAIKYAANSHLWLLAPEDNLVYEFTYVSEGEIIDTGWINDNQKKILSEIHNISEIRIRLGVIFKGPYIDFQNWFDNVRIVKYIYPEPTWSIGPEERPISLKSLEISPPQPSEGDEVLVNATFSSLVPFDLVREVSLHDGEDFNSSVTIASRNVRLGASSDTPVSLPWVASGGKHTLWLAISGEPVASKAIYVNHYPTLQPVPDQFLTQDRPFALVLHAEDTDGDRLSWSDDSPMFNIIPIGDRSAEINFTPSNDDVGLHTVNITVSDPHGCSDRKMVNFTVRNVNDNP